MRLDGHESDMELNVRKDGKREGVQTNEGGAD